MDGSDHGICSRCRQPAAALRRSTVTNLNELLAVEAAEYETRHFALRDDLGRLERVYSIGAHEASVLYCSRILECLVSDAITRLNLEPTPILLSNLAMLEWYNLGVCSCFTLRQRCQ